jgi:hypothetical protein
MLSLKDLFVCQSFLLATLSASAMEMKVCGNQVILSGAVEADDFSKVEAILTDNPTIKIAVLRNSPGGDALSGYKTGALFREKGITTYVSGYCRSSCSRFFLGGAERYFTADYAPEQTHIGFHSNYKTNGSLADGAAERLKKFITKYTDGKANEDLVDRWVSIPDRRGYVYFYHPEALKRNDGVSALLCHGRERSENRWNACEKISPHTALSMGIVTSLEIKQSCDANASINPN